ncbi:Hsp20 family protein [Catenovulum sp. 2E275]|uniref:Hsp20 family protein n=1 Tax=Catenovulum sp. 2E275 TaxID=2980497 RepID=UPI0021CE79B9|nr:Hsp20 family protein [Catenovulum sp. 2E275]MCU4676889.1 Hsp20 family protein [Catenovulum sp. 2E275]
MKTFDFTPLYRSFIGFDHLANMMDAAARSDKSAGYPPYNIELTDEDKYRITLAVAGFAEDELDINLENNTLTVTGKKAKADSEDTEKRFIYKGISARNFERKFQLSDHIKVSSAELEQGLLHIDLYREVPEALKPKSIPIGVKKSQDLLENK